MNIQPRSTVEIGPSAEKTAGTLVIERSSEDIHRSMGTSADQTPALAGWLTPGRPGASLRSRIGATARGVAGMRMARPEARADRRRFGDGGFTLVESVVASSILLVVAVGVVTTLVTTANWYAKARLRTQAYAVANQVMSNILSRNYKDIVSDWNNGNYPDGIPESMSWPPNGAAQFTVLSSKETTVDGKTGLQMARIDVSAIPVGQSLDPTVTVTRYASGWQAMASNTEKFPVTVRVSLVPLTTDVSVGAGAVVQLLNQDTLADTGLHATTNDEGIATLYNVPEDQYFLTVDYRSGPDLKAAYFPTRIAPTHGGSKANPINTVNSYSITVTSSAHDAYLRVGAYAKEGWTVVGTPVSPTTYQSVPGLIVYAVPVLNTGSANDNGFYGMGAAPLYPDTSKLPTAPSPYSGAVNSFGVAEIKIPYTVNADAGQYWKIWCRTMTPDGTPLTYELPSDSVSTMQSGSWTSDFTRPEGAYGVSAAYGSILQFSQLGTNVRPVNVSTEPTPTP